MTNKHIILSIFSLFSVLCHAQMAPIVDCDVLFEGTDPQVKKYVKEMNKEPLFIYTPEILENMLRDFPLVEASANLARTQGYTFFEVALKVNSSRAKNDYGYIEKGAVIKFFLLDGNDFYSNNLGNSLPSLAADKKATNYIASCGLDKEELKLLSNSYIDKIGIVWSKGYEEYEIYNPDFFVNQLHCLDN